MYPQTNSIKHSEYFDTISYVHAPNSRPKNRLVTVQMASTETLFSFSSPCRVTHSHGVALIVLTKNVNNPDDYQYYLLSGTIEVKANICFNILALTSQASIYLEPQGSITPELIKLDQTIQADRYQPQIQVKDIYAISHQERTAPFSFEKDFHPYYELILVEHGELIHDLDGQSFSCHKNDLIIYQANQRHSQHVVQDGGCSYTAVLFTAEGLEADLLNQPFHLSTQEAGLLDRILDLSKEENYPYRDDDIYALLTKLLIQLSRGQRNIEEHSVTSMRENYENELFETILDYLQENIEEVNEVQDLVDKFSLSRTSLQSLFKKFTGMSPKNYMNKMRLNLAKTYIRESSLTLTEIADKLNYGSIQYFSRAFKQEFGMSPSNYAKSLSL